MIQNERLFTAARARIPRSRHKGKRRGRIVDTDYLRWIRTMPCLAISSEDCHHAMTAHHVKAAPGAQKNDYRAVPLCLIHHIAGAGADAIHGCLGSKGFEEKFGVSLEVEIVRLNQAWVELGKRIKPA